MINKDKYVLAFIRLSCRKFNRIVAKYNGDIYMKDFSNWYQLLSTMWGQLCSSEYLREFIVFLEAFQRKPYYLRMDNTQGESTYQKTMENQD